MLKKIILSSPQNFHSQIDPESGCRARHQLLTILFHIIIWESRRVLLLEMPSSPLSYLEVFDRFLLFNQRLNQAKKWFNSILNSISDLKYSFNLIIYSMFYLNYSIQLFNELVILRYSIQSFIQNPGKRVLLMSYG